MSKQLNIAIISFHSCPLGKPGGIDTGGMNVYILEVARELGKRGHSVDIYTKAHGQEHGQEVALGQNIRLIHIEIEGGEELPKVALYVRLQEFACGVERFRKSAKVSYDLIHSHYWLSALAGRQLQVWWHVPHIVMLHTLGAVKNTISIDIDEPELRIESEKEAVHACDRIIAATPREERELVEYYGVPHQKIAVIPCGVNHNLFMPLDRELARTELGLDHQKVILFVGRLELLKGLEQLIKALRYLPDRQTLKLMIIGGDQRSQNRLQSLQNLVAELMLQDNVDFLGAIVQNRLPLFYNAADLSVIPSYYESFGMVALESLSCGTPVVATDVGAMSSIIRHPDAGYVIENNSPYQLASGITRLLSHARNEAQDVQRRRSLTASYSWSIVTDMILHEYTTILDNYYMAVSLQL